jgi:activator of HSP90 ATPase
MDAITVTGVVPGVSPDDLHAAFLDADTHAAMTGAGATVDGARFTAWDGYIEGETIDAGRPIVQRWRTSHFPDDAPDSRLEIHLRAVEGDTEVRFEHSEIPAGQGVNYEGGWVDFYLAPMRAHFGGGAAD